MKAGQRWATVLFKIQIQDVICKFETSNYLKKNICESIPDQW